MNYAESYAAWRSDPQAWWAATAQGITWTRPWDEVFDPSIPPYGRWFVGGELNTCFNCLDRHVEAGRGDQAALIWDSPMTGRVETFTYPPAAVPHGETGRRARRPRRDQGRPRRDLHAHGAGGR